MTNANKPVIKPAHTKRTLGSTKKFDDSFQALVDESFTKIVDSISNEVLISQLEKIEELDDRRVLGDIVHQHSDYDAVLDNLRTQIAGKQFYDAKSAISNRLTGALIKRMMKLAFSQR